MKKFVKVLLALLPFIMVTAIAAPPQKSSTKQSVKQVKKTPVKNPAEKKLTMKKADVKKSVEKKTKIKAGNKKTAQKKSAKSDKKMTKKQVSKDKKSAKSQIKTTSHKSSKKAHKAKSVRQKQIDKKVEKVESNAAEAQPLSQAKKAVLVPKCQDSEVIKVLSDAFKQQGKATGVPMTVRKLSQTRETQHYPQQGIRSCHTLVETNGKKYQTDYSVILNGNGFFVQVENAQVMF